MSVISTDASHTTLISAESRIDIQSSELDLRGLDTLFPQDKLSDETLDWLTKAKEKLTLIALRAPTWDWTNALTAL